MASLARKNIGHEWRRFLAAISILVLAGLLIYVQVGMVASMWSGIGAFERNLGADVIIKPIRNQPIITSGGVRTGRGGGSGRSFLPGVESTLWLHPNIKAIEEFGFSRANIMFVQNGKPNRIFLRTVETDQGSMTFPKNLGEKARKTLDTPGYVILTKNTAREFNLGLDDVIETEKGDLRIGGIYDGSFGMRIMGLISNRTADIIEQSAQNGNVQSYLLKLKDISKKQQTMAELELMLARSRVRVVTPEDSAVSVGLSEILKFGRMRSFFISSGFAIFIAIIIVVQTMRSAIQSQRTEFGALRALGISRWKMSSIAMEQAFWTGVISCVFAFSIAQTLQMWAPGIGLEILFSQSLVVGVSGLIMSIALFAGVLSLSVVLTVHPSELLR